MRSITETEKLQLIGLGKTLTTISLVLATKNDPVGDKVSQSTLIGRSIPPALTANSCLFHSSQFARFQSWVTGRNKFGTTSLPPN